MIRKRVENNKRFRDGTEIFRIVVRTDWEEWQENAMVASDGMIKWQIKIYVSDCRVMHEGEKH